jgi:hypothetical protein
VGAGAIGAVAVDHRLGGLVARTRDQVTNSDGATTASPVAAELTPAAQITSLSGSAAMWAL